MTSVYWQTFSGGAYNRLTIDGSNYGGASVNSPSLIIYNTDSGDTGNYVCTAQNSVGTTISDLVALIVSGSKFTFVFLQII